MRKSLRENPVSIRRAADLVLALIAIYIALKFVRGNETHQLRENHFGQMHTFHPPGMPERMAKTATRIKVANAWFGNKSMSARNVQRSLSSMSGQ